jgi:hypothetical protein
MRYVSFAQTQCSFWSGFRQICEVVLLVSKYRLLLVGLTATDFKSIAGLTSTLNQGNTDAATSTVERRKAVQPQTTQSRHGVAIIIIRVASLHTCRSWGTLSRNLTCHDRGHVRTILSLLMSWKCTAVAFIRRLAVSGGSKQCFVDVISRQRHPILIDIASSSQIQHRTRSP